MSGRLTSKASAPRRLVPYASQIRLFVDIARLFISLTYLQTNLLTYLLISS